MSGALPVAGGYSIAYRIVSADGHPVEGSIAFQLADGAVSAGSAGSSAGSAAAGSSSAAAAGSSAAGSANALAHQRHRGSSRAGRIVIGTERLGVGGHRAGGHPGDRGHRRHPPPAQAAGVAGGGGVPVLGGHDCRPAGVAGVIEGGTSCRDANRREVPEPPALHTTAVDAPARRRAVSGNRGECGQRPAGQPSRQNRRSGSQSRSGCCSTAGRRTSAQATCRKSAGQARRAADRVSP